MDRIAIDTGCPHPCLGAADLGESQSWCFVFAFLPSFFLLKLEKAPNGNCLQVQRAAAKGFKSYLKNINGLSLAALKSAISRILKSGLSS
jgi:hypothetical protein